MKKTIVLLFILFATPTITLFMFSKHINTPQKQNVIYLHEQKKASRSPQAHLNNFSSIGNVVLVFYADWCGPCNRMAPLIETCATKTPLINFIKINIDYFEALRNQFNIESVPTLIFLRDGIQINRYDGKPLSQKELNQLINNVYALVK